MKNIIILSIVLSLFPYIARGEDRAFYFGADASAGSSWSHGKYPEGYTSDPALNGYFGLSAGYGFADDFMFIAGAGYERNTLKLSFKDTAGSNSYSIVQQYALFKGSLRFFPVHRTYLEAGAYYGLKLGEPSYKYSGSSANSNTRYPGRETSNDYGFVIGAGYVYSFGDKISLDLGVSLMYGLADVYRDNSGFKLQTVSTSFKAGVMYRMTVY
jgi:hypothetical protein